MSDNRDAANPDDEHCDNVEHKDHQRLIPGRHAHRAHIQFAQFAIFDLVFVYFKLFAHKSLDDAHAAQALLHDRAQRACFVLHAQPQGSQAARDLRCQHKEDWHANHRYQCQLPVDSKENDGDRDKIHDSQERP